MRFMNAYVEAQIPLMRNFLRDISSLPGVLERSTTETFTSPVANNIDCGYELACLQNICQELFHPPSGQQSTSNASSVNTLCLKICIQFFIILNESWRRIGRVGIRLDKWESQHEIVNSKGILNDSKKLGLAFKIWRFRGSLCIFSSRYLGIHLIVD